MMTERKFESGLIRDSVVSIECAVQRAQRDAYSVADGVDAQTTVGDSQESFRNRAADLRARSEQAFKAGAAIASAASSYETLADVLHGSVTLPSSSPAATPAVKRRRS